MMRCLRKDSASSKCVVFKFCEEATAFSAPVFWLDAAKTPSEFASLKERIACRKQELLEYAQNLTQNGVTAIYREAQKIHSEEDEKSRVLILQKMGEAKAN